ncbi:MAG: c-type cytochrome [Chitinophagaceae bacterium]|nr:c-type cytochrome [Bacteroidota bacterium]MCC6256973.1 c-type cytochrome [Chitinophagaceae bacterium]MCW5916334.1 c-type cytochrome [Ferruginibacter sp.]
MANRKIFARLFLMGCFFSSLQVFAQTDTAAAAETGAPHLNPAFFLLVTVAVIFALLIGILGFVLVSASGIYLKKPLDEISSAGKTMIVSALLLGITGIANAQEPAAGAAAAPTASSIAGMTPTAFFLLVLTIFIETVVVLVLLWNISNLIKRSAEAKGKTHKSKFNWWATAIVAFLVLNGIYIWKYSGPEPEPVAPTAKVAAEDVNESNVKLLTDNSDISAGKEIFVKSCAVCHGNDGGGIIGPNLTDNYWLHGGDIKSVFKTIHDGINAMPPWKATYSGKEIEQVASFVESLKGTKPANPKAPEGKEG